MERAEIAKGAKAPLGEIDAMKTRTIEEVFSREYGNKDFAKFIRLAMSDNMEITNIREHNEKYVFDAKWKGHSCVKCDFPKTDMNVKGVYQQFKKTFEMDIEIERIRKGEAR